MRMHFLPKRLFPGVPPLAWALVLSGLSLFYAAFLRAAPEPPPPGTGSGEIASEPAASPAPRQGGLGDAGNLTHASDSRLREHKPGQAYSISRKPVTVTPWVAWSAFGVAFLIMISAIILFARFQRG